MTNRYSGQTYLMALLAASVAFFPGCSQDSGSDHQKDAPASQASAPASGDAGKQGGTSSDNQGGSAHGDASSGASSSGDQTAQHGGQDGKSKPAFQPPSEDKMPTDEFGKMVKLGEAVFVNTQEHAAKYVGNGLNCVNCHLDRGRKADAAPMWAAYVLYPKYRSKNKHVNTMQERIQGCFRYSMNGTPPEQGSEVETALVSYFFWLASNAPTGVKLEGQGYPELPKPAKDPDPKRGAEVYAANCAVCHGDQGQGQKVDGKYVFPPLWGNDSYNWGAGMHRVNTAAAFIRANMPLSQPGKLSEQEAWDVAAFVNSHDRPADPRSKGSSVPSTKKEHHDHFCYYGETTGGKTQGGNQSAGRK